MPSVATTHSYRNKSTAPATEWQQPPQSTVQPSNPVSSYGPTSTVEVAEEGFSQDEGEHCNSYNSDFVLIFSLRSKSSTAFWHFNCVPSLHPLVVVHFPIGDFHGIFFVWVVCKGASGYTWH